MAESPGDELDLSDYIKSLKAFEKFVDEATEQSRNQAGLASSTAKQYYGSVLFTRLCAISVSLLHLSPKSKWIQQKIEHWDYSSCAALTRNLIECYLNFFYLCVEEITVEEWDCRWNVFNLHDSISRRRMFALMKEEENDENFARQADELRERLLSNSHFNTLTIKQQKAFLKGDRSHLLSQDEICEKIGIEKTDFRFRYEFLSQQVHSLPMNFYRMEDGTRGQGMISEVEVGYTMLCHEWAKDFLLLATEQFVTLFAKEDPKNPQT